MAVYADYESLNAFSQEVDAFSEGVQADVLEAASRIFDKLASVDDDFFAAAGASATARTFYGDGTAYLKLPPFIASPTPTVTIPSGDYTVDADDITVKNGYLVFLAKTRRFNSNEYSRENRFTGWWDGVAVSVTAKWGFSAVPKDVAAATISQAMHTFRTIDPANAVVSGTDRVVSEQYHPLMLSTAELYREKYSQTAVFA